MRDGFVRSSIASALATAFLLLAPSVRAGDRPDSLVLLSMTDVRGRISPCGCKVPKGGLSRAAFLADSLRASCPRTLLLDNGGFFPDSGLSVEAAVFMMKAMHTLGFAAAGVAERDLRFGLPFLFINAMACGLPVTSANLVVKYTGRSVFPPYLMLDAGGVKVGVFSLLGEQVDRGPSGDTLRVQPPAKVAVRTIHTMRYEGANVVVLLSQLGEAGTEALVKAVPGIDAAIVGHEAPLLARGRSIGKTVLCYSGDDGHAMGRTVLTLDAGGAPVSGRSEACGLGPAIGDKAPVLAMVREFQSRAGAKSGPDGSK